MQNNKRSRGFTLAELLIVVAIIGVLVAISIPIFSGQLEKARQAVDLSNMRSAESVAMADWLTEGMPDTYRKNFDAGAGVMTDETPNGYGKSSKESSEFAPQLKTTGVPNNGTPQYLTVLIQDYTISLSWSAVGDGSGGISGGNNTGGGNTGGGGNPTNPPEVYSFLSSHADATFPAQDQVLQTGVINFPFSYGKVYEENGKYYISTTNQTLYMDQYNYKSLAVLSSEYAMCPLNEQTRFISVKDKIIDEYNSHYSVQRGDIFVTDEGEYYIAYNPTGWCQEPPESPWIKINW